MLRLLALASGLTALLGCAPCGSYEISGTTATNYEGEDYNGRWREQCGVLMGTSGVWDMMGDGLAEIWFSVDAPGDRSWQGIDVEITASFPTSALVPGATIAPPDLLGGAALNPCIDCRQDQAGLFDGTIEVLSGWTGDDPCEPEDGPTFKLRWDLTFGIEGGPRYVVVGADAVQFSTFVTDACSDVY